MKKFLACIMALALMLSGVSCFAEGENTPEKIFSSPDSPRLQSFLSKVL